MSDLMKYLADYPLDAVFPPFLEPGSKGMAVRILQTALIATGYGDPVGGDCPALTVDGDYGNVTVAAIKRVQADLGFTGGNVDGKFGPTTRAAFARTHGLDVNAIKQGPYDGLNGRTHFFHDGRDYGIWATDEEHAQEQIEALLDDITDD